MKSLRLIFLILFCTKLNAQKQYNSDFYANEAKKLMLETKEYLNAIKMIEKAIELDPKNEEYYFQKAEIYYKFSKCKEGFNFLIDYLDKNDRKNEKLILYIAELAECAYSKNYCLEILTKAYDGRYSDSKDILMGIIVKSSELMDYDKLIFYNKKYITIEPKNIENYISLSTLLYKLDRNEEVEDILKLGITNNPNNVKLLCNLAEFYFSTSNFDSCISTMDKVILEDPQIDYLKFRANVFEKSNQLEKALNDYKIILDKDKCNKESYEKVIQYSYENKMYEDVITYSLNFKKCYPEDNDKVLDFLYTSMFYCDQFRTGSEYLDKRLIKKPDFYLPYYSKAVLLIKDKQYKAALKNIELALNSKGVEENYKNSIYLLKFGLFLVLEDYKNLETFLIENDTKKMISEIKDKISKVITSEKITFNIDFNRNEGLIKTYIFIPKKVATILNEKYGITLE